MLTDHDFHPDEPTVRIFRTPSPGVLRLDDDVAISEAVHDGVVLRHCAFAGHWFKVNVITGQDELAEMLGRGVISVAEGRGAERGLQELLDLIEQERLLRWLAELAPFGPCQPPPAPPMRRGRVPTRLRAGTRRTW